MAIAETYDFSVVYAEYYPKVLGYVYSKIANKSDVEDIVSEIFIKVMSGLKKYDKSRASISTWIYVIAKNSVISYYRRHKADCVPLDDMNEPIAEDNDEMDFDTLLDVLYQGLKQLTDVQRNIVVLHYWEGLPHREIAEKMNLSYSNTQKICSLALKTLRTYLQAYLS